MAIYKIGEGLAEINVEHGVLKSIYLLRYPSEPTTLYVPAKIGRQTILYVGDGSFSIFGKPRTRSYFKAASKNLSIVFDDAIPIVNNNAFSYAKLKELSWPASCGTIPYCCFFQSSIDSITNLDDIKHIKNSAFRAFSGMECFDIPKSCTHIDSKAFQSTELIGISGGENVISIGDNMFSLSNIKTFRWFPKINIIPCRTFAECRQLDTVEGTENVIEICGGAFSGSRIKHFIWPDSCKTIPHHCFYHCSELVSITNTDSVRTIGEVAFAYCRNLKSFDFSSNLLTLERGAFFNSALSKADLSLTSVEYVSSEVFDETPCQTNIIPNIGCIVE